MEMCDPGDNSLVNEIEFLLPSFENNKNPAQSVYLCTSKITDDIRVLGLVSLFNDLSTSVGYLMPNPSYRRTVIELFNPWGFIFFPKVLVQKWIR